MRDSDMKYFLQHLLYQDSEGRHYIKINGTSRRFNFSKSSDVALLNSIIDGVRPAGFRWDIPRFPKCGKLVATWWQVGGVSS